MGKSGLNIAIKPSGKKTNLVERMLNNHLSVGVGDPGKQVSNRSVCLLVDLGLGFRDRLWLSGACLRLGIVGTLA